MSLAKRLPPSCGIRLKLLHTHSIVCGVTLRGTLSALNAFKAESYPHGLFREQEGSGMRDRPSNTEACWTFIRTFHIVNTNQYFASKLCSAPTRDSSVPLVLKYSGSGSSERGSSVSAGASSSSLSWSLSGRSIADVNIENIAKGAGKGHTIVVILAKTAGERPTWSILLMGIFIFTRRILSAHRILLRRCRRPIVCDLHL